MHKNGLEFNRNIKMTDEHLSTSMSTSISKTVASVAQKKQDLLLKSLSILDGQLFVAVYCLVGSLDVTLSPMRLLQQERGNGLR